MAPCSSTLAWKIPWTEEPGGLQSMESRRVGHDRATSLSLFTFMHWRRKWQPTPVFLPGESQGHGSLVGCRLWGRTEPDTTEATQYMSMYNIICIYICLLFFFCLLWLELAVSLPPSQLDSDKTVAGQALFKLFLLRAGLVKNRMFCCISEWFLFPPPAGSMKRFFSDTHCENLVEFQEIKHKSARPFKDGIPLEILSLACPQLASSSSSILVQVQLPLHGFSWGLCLQVSGLVSC